MELRKSPNLERSKPDDCKDMMGEKRDGGFNGEEGEQKSTPETYRMRKTLKSDILRT